MRAAKMPIRIVRFARSSKSYPARTTYNYSSWQKQVQVRVVSMYVARSGTADGIPRVCTIWPADFTPSVNTGNYPLEYPHSE